MSYDLDFERLAGLPLQTVSFKDFGIVTCPSSVLLILIHYVLNENVLCARSLVLFFFVSGNEGLQI